MTDTVKILTLTQSLTGTHMSGALIAARDAEIVQGTFRNLQRHERSIAAIIHAYAALDSGLNLVGYYLFDDESNKLFMHPEKRDVPLAQFAKNWSANRLSVTDKIRYLATLRGAKLNGRVDSLITELSTLRNWLVHGLIYHTVALVTQDQPGLLSVHDREDLDRKGKLQNWVKPFPNAKFRPIPELDHVDAQIAICVVLEALSAVCKPTAVTFPFVDYRQNEYKAFAIDAAADPLESIVKLFGKAPYR